MLSRIDAASCWTEFGADNFVGEIAWQKADSPRSDNKAISVSHDTIIVYRKSSAATFNRHPRTEAMNARFKSPDGDPEPWFDDNPTAASPGPIFGIQHPMTGEVIYPGQGRFWAREQAWFFAQMSQYAQYTLRDIDDEQRRAKIAGNRRVPRNMDAIMLATDLESARRTAQERDCDQVTGRMSSSEVVVKEGSARNPDPENGACPRILVAKHRGWA